MYDINVDERKSLVVATLGGMMSVDEVADYIAALQRAFIAHHLRSYAMVIDVRGCPIQSQDMVGAMRHHMVTMPKARALAVVVGGSLARMQVRRLFTQPYVRIVGTLEEAHAWVLHGTEPDDHHAPAPVPSRPDVARG